MVKKKPIRIVKQSKKSSKKTFSKKRKSKLPTSFWVGSIVLGTVLIIIVFYRWNKNEKIKELEKFNTLIPAGFKAVGIDVSHHQGRIDWKDVLDESPLDTMINFVYCKATEGSTHIDSEWEYNKSQLSNLAVKHGAYHFLNTNTYSIPQAKHFLNHWNPSEFTLQPVLDVETESESDKILIANMYDWLEYVEEKTGYKPIIYTSESFYQTKFQNEFKEYEFWIASYTNKPASLKDKRVKIWQFTDQAQLPSVETKIDVNVSKIRF
jgi:lysozyme